MKKMILTLTLLISVSAVNACGGFHFDNGTRAQALTGLIQARNLSNATILLEQYNVATQMRFKTADSDEYKSVVGYALELGWLAR